jgi:hypothetical protein
MTNLKTINTFTAHTVEQLVTDRAPIHTYRKAILAAKPYISFVYIDADTLPTVTNIPLVQPSLCTRFIDDATRQPELHVLYRGDSKRGYDGQTSKIQAFTLSIQTNSVEVTIRIGEQHVSLDSMFNPKDRREIPFVQSLTIDAQTSTIENTISCTTLRPSLAVTFNPADQREKLTLQSLKQDVRSSSVEKTISIVEQKASLDVVFDHDKKHEEISTIPYILDNRSAQYTNATTREEQQYDSYNHSIAIMEPRCHDYPVSKTRNRSKIVRYNRYSRTSHIASSNTGIDFNQESG